MTGTSLDRRRAQDRERAVTLRDQVQQVRPYLAQLGVDPHRFGMTILTEARRNPKLLECAETPEGIQSLLGAGMLTAQLGLEPGPLEHVYFIARNSRHHPGKEVQWYLGWRGQVALAERLGWRIVADVVYSTDTFAYTAQPPSIEHAPDILAERDDDDIVAAYAIAHPPDGGAPYIAVINRQQIHDRRGHSDAYTRKEGPTGPWVRHYPAMCRKSAVRALFPQLPTSAVLERATAADETVVVPSQVAPLGDSGEPRLTLTATVDDDPADDAPSPHPDGTCDTPACPDCGGPLPPQDPTGDGPEPTWRDLLDDRGVDPPRFLAAARAIVARHGGRTVRTLDDLDTVDDPKLVDALRTALDRAAGQPETENPGTRNAEQPPLAPPPEAPA